MTHIQVGRAGLARTAGMQMQYPADTSDPGLAGLVLSVPTGVVSWQDRRGRLSVMPISMENAFLSECYKYYTWL